MKIKRGRQVAGVPVALAKGQLSFMDARCACTQEQADTVSAVFMSEAGDFIAEAVLLQCQQGETVIAAVEVLQSAGHIDFVDSIDLAYPGVQRGIIEVAFAQAACSIFECRKCGCITVTQRICQCCCCNGEAAIGHGELSRC